MSGPAASIAAQAKLNLHLRVQARDDTGYHSIDTIFHRIELSDSIVVHVTDGERTIDVEGADAGPGESNLAFRAATAYAASAGWPAGFRIALTKRIPIGAGLGGGSADAAAVFRVLDYLAPKRMGSHVLAHISSSLGADVTFFTSDAVMARGSGYGEVLAPMPPLPRMDVLLLTPPYSVSTVAAYGWLDDDRRKADNSELEYSQPDDSSVLASWADELSWHDLAEWARNDFEPVVVARHPELGSMLATLRASRAIFAGMTGSGSTIYGILDGPADFAKLPMLQRPLVTSTMTAIDVVQPIRIE